MTDLVPVTRTIVDYPDRLEHYLRTASAGGRLVTAARDINPVALESGRFAIKVTVREPAPAQRLATFDQRHPILGPCLKALTFGLAVVASVAGVLFGIGWLIWSTVGAATLSSIGLGIALVLGLAAAALRSGDHPGHQKGMGFHWTKCK